MVSSTQVRGDHVTVVSVDTHIGPLMSQLRNYCPQALLDDFDAFVASLPEDPIGASLSAMLDPPEIEAYRWNARALGHHDVAARIADMDRDGVACEVVFHSSANGQPMPFSRHLGLRERLSRRGDADDRAAVKLEMAGLRMFNRWLVDYCSVERERHVGVCQLSMADMDATIDDVVWAHEQGFKAVNFPAPSSALPTFDDPVWDSF
jgi:hypothetical protein